MEIAPLILFWIVVWIKTVSTLENSDKYVHVVTSNGVITGLKKPVHGKVINTFLGIPFAKPPIGKLRFRNPEPMENWTNALPALTLPKTCFQNLPEQHELNNPAWRVWVNNTEMSEDCLYLNIWTPSLPYKPYNVYEYNFNKYDKNEDEISSLVWIHGGGFTSGSSTLDMYNGEILASRMNVIVINIQYRLGPFGFLSFNNKEIPGNQGLMDQVLALKWLNANIRNFGGNPKYITLFGANSGAASASFHLLSPLTQKLFNQAIMQSGSALSWWAYESPQIAVTKARHFAKLTGCSGSKETNQIKDVELFECLRSLDPVTLIVNQWKMLNELYREKHRNLILPGASFYFDIPFKPINESAYLPRSPMYYLTQNTSGIAKKRVLLGTTKNEGLVHLLKGFRMYFMPSDDSLIQPPQFRYGSTQIDPFDLLAQYLVDERFLHHFFIEAIAYEYELPTKLFQHFHWKPSDIIKVFDNIAGDYSFKCPVVDFADLYLKISKVYLYSFEHQSKYLPLPPWTGVLQGQEIAYIFGKPFDMEFQKKYYNFTAEERDLSNKMMTFWTNFAQTGHPNNRMKEYHTRTREMYWEMYADNYAENYIMESRKHIVIQNKTVYTNRNFRRHQCLFWRSYLPLMGNNLLSNTKCPPRKKPVLKNTNPTSPQSNFQNSITRDLKPCQQCNSRSLKKQTSISCSKQLLLIVLWILQIYSICCRI